MPQKSTRRRFIAHSAAALAAPHFLANRGASAEESKSESANEKLNVAAIGVGDRGTVIGKQAGRLGNMVAVADVDSSKANRFSNLFGGKCKVYEDYRRILDRKDVQAITCGSPDHWHVKIAVDALRAGKDVYCEKPLTLTLGESKIITEVVKETGRTFQVGTQQRSEYRHIFLKAIAIARSGRLGKKLHALSSVGTSLTGGPYKNTAPPKELNYDFWLGQAAKADFCSNRVGPEFRWWLEYSGGQVTDWGVHHTDIAIWALNGQDTGVKTAEGQGTFPGLSHTTNVLDLVNGRIKSPQQYNVAHTFDCALTLHNGNTINLTSGPNELIISGDKGKIRVNRGGLTGKIVEEIAASKKETAWLNEEVKKLYRNMPMQGHMANFFHCIKTKELPVSDVYTHCNSVNACHLANIAMLLKRKLEFDHKTYTFIGDAEANLFINREQRSPYGAKA